MTLRKAVTFIVFAAGVLLALAGVLLLAAAYSIGTSGAIVAVAAAYILAAAPAIALPFSSRVARVLWLLFLLYLGAIFIWFAFSPAESDIPRQPLQVAAVGFCGLLVVRIILALRNKPRPAA